MTSKLWTLLLALLLVACGQGRKDAPRGDAAGAKGPGTTLKIVSSLPRTGSANAQTTTMVNGIKLALDEVGGTIGPYTIAYEDWDDASAKKGDWDPEVEAANADRAIKDPDVVAYLGTYNSGAAKIAMPVLNQAGLVMVSPGNTYTGLTKPGLGEAGEPEMYRPSGEVTYFRVVPADDIQGRLGAEWMAALGGKTVYVLDDRSLYGKGVADVLVASLERAGVKLLGREGVDPKAQEYKSVMAKLKGLDPDFVYFGGTTQTNAGQIAKDLVAVGLRARFMVPDGCFEEAFIEAAGADNLNGRAYVTFGGVPASKLTGKGAEFVARYQKRFGSEPEAYAVYGYMAAKVVLDAIRRAGGSDRKAVRAAVRKAVAATEERDGVLGSWRFDANGDTTLETMSGNAVKAGKFEFVTVLEGNGSKPKPSATTAPSASAEADDAPPPAIGETGTVKLVSSLPRTGSANAQTTTIVNGIKLALDEVGGKIGGLTVAYEDWDDASAKKGDWDPEVEAANADRAIKDPDVVAYLGTYNSGAAKIAMPVLNQAGLVMISPGNTYTGLTKPGLGELGEPEIYRPSGKVSYFRVVPADDIQGRLGAKWMAELGGKTVYVLDDRSLYGKGVADVFVASAASFGVKVLGREGVDPKAQEYKSVMAKLKGQDPDFVYFGGTTQTNAGQIAKDLVAVGLRAKIMVPDGCFEEAFIKAAGPENVDDRAFVTFGGVPASKLVGKGAEFVARYRDRYQAEPEAYAVYGYVAAKVALDAIRRTGKRDRAAIREAVARTRQVDGVLGTWRFDANGDTTLEAMSGNAVKAGKFEFVTVLEGSSGGAANGPEAAPAAGPTVAADQATTPPEARGSFGARLVQQLLLGFTNGMVFALIALGYTMVYGILELINFAHGDLFMLASFLALTLVGALGLSGATGVTLALGLVAIVVVCAAFSAVLNVAVDRLVYKRLRNAPKLAPLVSAIGVSFIFQNLGLFWGGLPMEVFGGGTAAAAPKAFPSLLPSTNLLGGGAISVSVKDLVVILSSLVVMAGLYGLVRFTKLGKAMRATAQDPVAARLMGIDVDRVIGWTFAIGGALAGFAAVVYALYINTISYQIGYQNGLYAFTAAVLGGIGNIPGAVLGGIVIGLVRALSDAWIGAQWQPAVLFGILIVILVFRPSGLLGVHTREKV